MRQEPAATGSPSILYDLSEEHGQIQFPSIFMVPPPPLSCPCRGMTLTLSTAGGVGAGLAAERGYVVENKSPLFLLPCVSFSWL